MTFTVMLQTRCGCRREVQTTFPPPPEIMLDLLENLDEGFKRLMDTPDGKISEARPIARRVFKLALGSRWTQVDRARPEASFATYFEDYTWPR